MRHLLRTAIAFLMLAFVAPPHVEAGILSWLDKLSGPGPFWTVDFGIALRCPPKETDSRKPRTFAGDGYTFSCPNEHIDKRGFNWYLNAGIGGTTRNKLNYGDRPEPAPSTAIGLVKMGISLDYRLDPSLDVGVGAGFLYFGGPSFVNFARPYFQPLRVSVRPLLLGWRCDQNRLKRDSWLIVNFNLTMVVGTIAGADFGAPGDRWRSHNEIKKEIAVGIDVVRLRHRKSSS